MYRLTTCFWVSVCTASPQGLSAAPNIVKVFLEQFVCVFINGVQLSEEVYGDVTFHNDRLFSRLVVKLFGLWWYVVWQ